MQIQFRGIWNDQNYLNLTLDSESTIDVLFRHNKRFKDWCLKEYLPRERLTFYYWPFDKPMNDCIRLLHKGTLIESGTKISDLGDKAVIHVIGRRIAVLSDEELASIMKNGDSTRVPIIEGNPDMRFRDGRYVKECIVCFENEANVCLKTCGHLLMCLNCTSKLDKCSVCDMPYKAYHDSVKVYM